LATAAEETAKALAAIWTVPEVGALPDDAHGRLVRRGRDLITATYAQIGPEVPTVADRYAGNNLACGNCHLEGGTKKFGIPLFGLFGEYPRYNARSGHEISIKERVDGCMMRSMNGRPLPEQAPQMQAIVAYIAFLSTGVAPGQVPPGLGVGRMPELTRAADPARGRPIYRASARPVTALTDRACAAACPPSTSATSCRRSGERTASMTAPA
jgi:thiosulfate dehydrogenase